jgi:pimeloyl-ACP methyl ester carboxylesterase
MWGEKDSIFSRLEQDSLLSALPKAVFKVYLETGHDPHWERPEQFVKDLEEFLMKDKW